MNAEQTKRTVTQGAITCFALAVVIGYGVWVVRIGNDYRDRALALNAAVHDNAVLKVAAAHRACVTMLKVAHSDAEVGTVLRTVVQPSNITCALALEADTLARP